MQDNVILVKVRNILPVCMLLLQEGLSHEVHGGGAGVMMGN